MLVERYRELLTAYVDGELTSRQRRHVARLLHRSPEARQLLRKLQADAQFLRTLPRPHLDVDLTADVLRGIAERCLTPGQRRAVRLHTPTSWLGPVTSLVTAAAVLLILGVASYLYFAASLDHPGKPGIAQSEPDPAPAPVVPDKPVPNVVATGQSPPTPTVKPAPARSDNPTVSSPPQIVKRPDKSPPKPSREALPEPAKEESILTDRLEMFRLREVHAVLPVVLRLHELDRAPVRNELLDALRKDVNFRLELPCQNGSKAFDRVQTVARAMNIGLVIEKRAQDRLKTPTWKTNYVVYLEDLTSEELTQFIQRIGDEDRKQSTRKPSDGQFDRLVLTRMTAEHHKELSTLMGIDPTETEPAPKGPLGTDLRKPLSDLTALQVGETLAGKGSSPRPEAGKPVAKPPTHLALALAYNPVRPSPGSIEIKRFLESRRAPRRPGTVRVLLVLRG